jgi:phosphate transport system substrate-binding protein
VAQFRWIFMVFLSLSLAACQNPTAGNITPSSDAYIQNIGSDTMVNLALAWAEQYQQEHPDVQISVTGGGSGTGIAALINGTVDIANASRAMKAEEIQLAQDQGFEPMEFIVARDAIAVIVNLENPISELTLEQISMIYKGIYTNWSQLGGDDRPIVKLSRETNSGTHVYFLENVIRLGNKQDKSIFSADTLLLPSSEGIISEVRDNPNAIGYDGLGYITDEVKVIAVAKDAESLFIIPSAESVNDGEYAIARDLYMYTHGDQEEAINNYIQWILSPEAQAIVTQLGFVPIVSNPAGN